MLKNLSQFELFIEGKVYNFMCSSDSPLEHVKEALFQFQKYVGQIEDSIKAQQQKAQSSPENDQPASDQPEEKPKE